MERFGGAENDFAFTIFVNSNAAKKNITLSDFYGLLQIMNIKLNKIISDPGNKSKKLAADMQKCLNEQKIPLIENSLMRCAMFLDPRYKCDIDSNNDLVIFVKMTLENLWQRIQAVKNAEEPNEISIALETQNNSKLDNIQDLYEELDAEYSAILLETSESTLQSQLNSPKSTLADAIHNFELFVSGAEPRMKCSESIQAFWEQNKSTFGSQLYDVASVIFAIPPTQSTVERYFSALKYLFDEHRFNLSEDLLENCLLVHLNPDFYEIAKQKDIMTVIDTIRKESKQCQF